MKSRSLWLNLLCSVSCLFWLGCGPSAPSISLQQAVEQGNLQAVQQHIAAKTDLNQPDSTGWTALQIAAKKGNLAIVQALTSAGADLNQTGQVGKTPLAVARENRQMAVVQFLEQGQRGRPLIDGGVGVSGVLDQ